MESKQIKDVAKEARSLYGPQLKKTAPFLFFFFLVTMVVWLLLLLLNYSGYGSLFLTILVIGAIEMPFFLGVQVCSYMAMLGEEITFHGFLKTATLYFRREFNGVYRVINCFLFSFLIALLGGVIFAVVYYAASPLFDASFIGEVSSLMEAMEAGENGTINTILTESKSIVAFDNLFSLVVEMVFVMTVIFKISRNSAMVFIRDFLMAADPRLPVAVYKDTVKHNKEYNKDFYRATWFVYLTIALFYIGGAVLAYFLFKEHAYRGMLMNMVGIGFGAVPGIILLPYFLNVVYFVTNKHKRSFMESSLDLAKRAFEQLLLYDNQMSEEDKKKLEDALREYEKQVKSTFPEEDQQEVVEENETNTDDESHNDNNLDDYGSSDHH